MLSLIFLVVFISAGISFICSIMEVVLFVLPIAYAKAEADKGNKAAKIIFDFKEDVSRPISAILILNTGANIIGAALAGSLMSQYSSSDIMLVGFSILYALLLLIFSEILPKRFGAIYSRQIAFHLAYPLKFIVKVLSPLVFATDKVASLVAQDGDDSEVGLTEQEFLSFTKIGVEEGTLDSLEGSIITNIIGLNNVLVESILTPRVMVFRISEEAKISEFKAAILEWNYTRVPTYADDEENITGYVIQRDIYRALLRGEFDRTIKEFRREIITVPEQMRADRLLLQFFETKMAIASVVDEHGGFAGIITMEDIMEEIVGREIVDEYDLISDLRMYANILHKKKRVGKGL